MKIYIEAVFILNFLLDFMILYGTKRILKRNNKLIRVVIGSIVGSFTTFLLFISISNLLLLVFKILISILLIGIALSMDTFSLSLICSNSYNVIELIAIFTCGSNNC